MPGVHSPSSTPHKYLDQPSPWVVRWAHHVPAGGAVLDVACGGGRHARFFAGRNHAVDAVDRDAAALATLQPVPGINTLCADIESGPWPCAGRAYAGVIVTHYLYRPLLPTLLSALAPGGALIYETFASGNERFGRPSNPDFLLQHGELLELVRGRLRVIAYEDVYVDVPKPALMQRICAVRQES